MAGFRRYDCVIPCKLFQGDERRWVSSELLAINNITQLNHFPISGDPEFQTVVCCCAHTEFASAFDMRLFDSYLISGLWWAGPCFI